MDAFLISLHTLGTDISVDLLLYVFIGFLPAWAGAGTEQRPSETKRTGLWSAGTVTTLGLASSCGENNKESEIILHH